MEYVNEEIRPGMSHDDSLESLIRRAIRADFPSSIPHGGGVFLMDGSGTFYNWLTG